ncbi:BTAD domain-containing putative transcriptional regulator [Paractinoplanes brasiliensis]|uniref:Transcriptional regulator n=1 Tax=Paractinoplanes brasiliensis TaxID=52695 RepID=A0A4R6JA05_9ACTN|nr:BTAD domain-containing putative transcriptional regulator [Actinoplanes brasiliensis]TDO31741.1 transcriptional regulator [Actinoplanes brasiliensis]GID30666.1 ATPase AAA [Actinoplanes brasiliensis]
MQVAVLGPARATRAGEPVVLGAPKHRALLAALALHAGRPVTADALIDLLWGDDPPPAAAAALQTYVAHLRKALEPGRAARTPPEILLTTPQGYRLDVAGIDAIEFAAVVERTHRDLNTTAPPDERPPEDLQQLRATLDAALALWAGAPYADLGDSDPARAERARLEELRLVALEDRALVRLALGEPSAVAAELAALAAEHPLRESICALRVRAHARAGHQGRALELLREMRRRLDEELGIEPGPALRELETAVPRQETFPVRPQQPRDPPMAGRETELAQLNRTLAHAAATGTPAVAMLVGEPGIGKTRLAGAVVENATARGFAVGVGRCSQDEGAPPLWPWSGVLRQLRDTALAERLITGTWDNQFALWHEVTAALTGAAERRPLLIVLDDLHWADPSTLKLLRHLIATATGRLAILTTRRSHPEPAGALGEVLEALARHGATRIDLEGLAEPDVRALVRSITGRDAGHDEAARLRDRTGGNAFLLTELVKLDTPVGDSGPRDPLRGGVVPAAVADVVAARTAKLPEPARDLLRLAAVIGRDFDLDLLAAVTGESADDVLDRLEPALSEGLVTEAGPEEFRFSHALVRDAVHDGIPATRRARRHASVAARVTDPARAARHWLAAGPRHARDAWQACVAAARKATAVHAWDEAAALLATAIDTQGNDPAVTASERYAVLMDRVVACRQGGDLDGLDAAQVAAVEVAAGTGDVRAEARAAIAAVDGAVWLPRPHPTVHPTLPTTLRGVLRKLPAADSELRCQVMLALAVELYFADAPAERRALVEQGLAMARRLADPGLLDWSCTVAWLAIWRPSTAEERWALAQEALTAATRSGNRIREVTVRTLVAISAQETGRIAEMDEEIARARADAERYRLATPLVALGWLEMPWLALRGRFADAEKLFAETNDLMSRTSMPQAVESAAGSALMLRMIRGDNSAEMARQLQALAPHSRLPLDSSIVMLLLRAGLADEARAWHAAHGLDIDHPEDWYTLVNLCQAAEASAGLGDLVLAAKIYHRLSPYAGRPCSAGGAVGQPPVDAYLSIAAAAAGERERAVRHARDALALCDQWRLPLVAEWIRRTGKLLSLA